MHLVKSIAVVLIALLALPASRGGTDCPVGGTSIAPHPQRERIERTLSANAELVAESTSGKRRLVLMNSHVVVTRTKRATRGSTVERVLAATSDPGTIADQPYLATLSRRPAAAERAAAIDYLKAGTLAERTEDLQFVRLNTLEFLFQ